MFLALAMDYLSLHCRLPVFVSGHARLLDSPFLRH